MLRVFCVLLLNRLHLVHQRRGIFQHLVNGLVQLQYDLRARSQVQLVRAKRHVHTANDRGIDFLRQREGKGVDTNGSG